MKNKEEIMLVFIIVMAISCHATITTTTTDPAKTHLVGRDGLCLDSDGAHRYNFPKIVPCKPMEDTQLWTFPDDGTIRWHNDRCLFPDGMEVLKYYTYVKTGECGELKAKDKTWIFNKNGTIVHVHSGLVLTVQNNAKSVNVEPNRNEPSQIWNAVDHHVAPHVPRAPRVGKIMGRYSHKCLFFNPTIRIIQLGNCYTWGYQLWSLFDDSTIRVSANTSLCMTSFRSNPYYRIGVFECQGKVEQRWEVDLDNFTIHHPDSTMVMDAITIQVLGTNHELITLFGSNGASTQKWMFYD